jgi:hypothetical protein
MLLVAAAMVIDFGLVRVDRQVDKSAADEATLAGLHALNTGGAEPHPFVGVCTAVRYLQKNNQRFEGVSESSGWTRGTGTPVAGNACTNTTLQALPCDPLDKSTWAKFSWSGTGLQVVIESGYSLAGSTGWSEDSLPAAQADPGDATKHGCDQLAVTVTQSRKPGFGSLATSSDLVSSIRTVGRVKLKPGGSAPAMLLLRRTGCPVLETGSNSGQSHVYLYGALSSDGRSQGGSIHADSNGASCSGGSNQNIFLGKGTSGIVAFSGPTASNPSLPDISKPGTISSVAGSNGSAANVISDGLSNVFSSGAVDESGMAAASKAGPTGRGQVSRKPVDDRYLGNTTTGVTGIVNASASKMALTAATAALPANGYTVVTGCTPTLTPSQLSAVKIYVDCANAFKGPVTFGSATTEVVFRGWVDPNGLVSIPNAMKVYIQSKSPAGDGVTISNGNELRIHDAGNMDAATSLCTSATRGSTNKAVVVLKTGAFKQTGGQLRMCNTTVVQLGNDPNGCLTSVPSQQASGPSGSPCGGGTGDGQLSQNNGAVDWTAPNSLDVTTDSAGDPTAAALAGWGDLNGPEDLAFWSESGTDSSHTYNMGGGATLHVVGVYMAPNAQPFIIGGGSVQTLINAQYIASSISLNGTGTQIRMKVDPNAAITLPDLGLVGLVR